MESLEPATPRTLPDPPFRYRPALPSSVLPVADILRNGTRIPHQLIVDKQAMQSVVNAGGQIDPSSELAVPVILVGG
ncbi:hypothetical protein ACEQ6C_39845, partial [Rhizobium ruizarguesonis]